LIIYKDSLEGISEENLSGFFDDWPNPPTSKKLYKILNNSNYIVLAQDSSTQDVVGFINALSDEILSVYIPLLEVLPNYRGQGIGSQLVKRMIDNLKEYYIIDLICDEALIPYYQKLGMKKSTGMIIRNYVRQSGIE
jgi:ribosomal protein S18 acetylase RimI-like enzyme